MIKFLINIRPKPQQRHRNNGRFQYDPSSKDKQDFIFLAKQYAPITPHKGIIELDITFCYKRPKSHYRTKNKEKILKDNSPFYKIGVPDTDNLCKFYMDAMEKLFYLNDSQIVSLSARKLYGSVDSVMIKIIPKHYLRKFE